ncbi:MAG: trigger factor [Syntrophales bacterium]
MSETALNVRVEEISSIKKKISFDIPWEDVKKELDSVYGKIGKKAKIKGFRPGKTPRKILEAYYRHEAEDEAISSIINKFYWDAVEKNHIIPAAQPVIDQAGIETNKAYSFSATVEIKPVIEPKDYIGLEIEKEEIEITDEDVARRLSDLQQAYSTLETIQDDRPAIAGDYVFLDFEGKMDGKPLDGMKSENYLLEIGSKTFVPGFEEHLIGLKKGDTKEFTIKFPDNYHKTELAGKDVSFSVAVKELKEKKVPGIDENFLKNFEQYESLDALREDIRRTLEEEGKEKSKTEFTRKIIDRLLESNPFEVPSSMVDRQIYIMMLNAQRQMSFSGMDPKRAAELSYQMRESFRDEAARIVRSALLLESIAQKESIKAQEDEVESRLKEIAAKYAKDIDSLRASYEKEGMMDDLRSEIVEQKTLAFIEGKAKINIIKKRLQEKED